MSLLIKPDVFDGRVATFGFELLAFKTVVLKAGERLEETTGGREVAIVPLGGVCSVRSTAGDFAGVGGRKDVFSGLPHTLYLPVECEFTLTAESDCDLAFCYSKAEEKYPAAVVRPEECRIEKRGAFNQTRQINHMLQPGFAAHRILICEVFTPSGNWSSYPPHKHDVHNPPGEVDLEEIYYYRIDRPEGYAVQRVYTGDGRIDETMTVRSGELVLVPEGYHPVVSAPGYTTYYLNALAGSARSMAASDDPQYAWVRETWTQAKEN